MLTSTLESAFKLHSSFAYRHRIAITTLAVLAGLCGTLLVPPGVVEGSTQDRIGEMLGWTTLVSGILLRLWCSLHICGRKAKSLVTTGPYAMCRNPLYVGTLLIAVSQMLFLKSWPFVLVSMIPSVLYIVGVVPAEERLLSQRFGAEYLDYCCRVPRWRPRWSALNLHWSRPESWPRFREECLRSLWWLLLPLASQTICLLREVMWSID
jgi:protein-S-isoprenylcysteine O-methyltransferase Ste14